MGGAVFPPCYFSSVQSLSLTLCDLMNHSTPHESHQASLSITNSRSLLKFISMESVMPSNHLIFCHSLLFLSPVPPSIRVFSSKSTLRIRWPEYWNFSFSISPSNEHPGLISFRMDWLDLIAVQGTLPCYLPGAKLWWRRRQWWPIAVLVPGKSHEEPGRLQSMGSWRVGHDWAISLSFFTFMHWRRKWQLTPVFLPGESQGWQSLVAAVYGVTQGWTWLKQLSSSSKLWWR